MKANCTLLQIKYAEIIRDFAELSGLSLRDALDFFYHSRERELIRDGVSDLHCMSSLYLAQDLLNQPKECRESPEAQSPITGGYNELFLRRT